MKSASGNDIKLNKGSLHSMKGFVCHQGKGIYKVISLQIQKTPLDLILNSISNCPIYAALNLISVLPSQKQTKTKNG